MASSSDVKLWEAVGNVGMTEGLCIYSTAKKKHSQVPSMTEGKGETPAWKNDVQWGNRQETEREGQW